MVESKESGLAQAHYKIGDGSVYGLQVRIVSTAKIAIRQDNGQEIVVHINDLKEMIKVLKSIYEGPWQ
jgi:hypothetical protein